MSEPAGVSKPSSRVRQLTFLDLPGELRNNVYHHCKDWAVIDIGSIDKMRAAYHGLSNSNPFIAKEWNDWWYKSNTFFFDARESAFTGTRSGGKEKNANGHSPTIAAWFRWLKDIGDCNAGLIRKLHVHSDFFTAKFQISSKEGGGHRVKLTLVFRHKGGSLRHSRRAARVVQAAREGIESYTTSLFNGPLTRPDLNLLVRTVLRLVPYFCSMTDTGHGPVKYGPGFVDSYLERRSERRCRRGCCFYLNGYLEFSN